MKKDIIKRTAIRFLSGIMSAVMLSGILAEGKAFADETSTTTETETTAVSEIIPDNTSTTTTTTTLPEGSIVIEVDGEQIVVQKGNKWLDETIEGDEQPLYQAKSTEEFVGTVPGFDAENNLYTLTVATGMNAGSSVEYFAIRYLDDNDVPQTKYLFPKSTSLKMTNDYISNYEIEEVYQYKISYEYWSNLSSNYGWNTVTFRYYLDENAVSHSWISGKSEEGFRTVEELEEAMQRRKRTYEEYYAPKKDYYRNLKIEPSTRTVKVQTVDFSKRHDIIKGLGYKVNESTATDTALAAWSVDEYLFKCDTGLSKVTGIEAFMSKGKWTVQGMSVSRVNKINGYGEYGYVSGKYFLSLEKDKIAQLRSYKSGAQTFSAAGDKLLNIGGDTSIYYGLDNYPGKETSSSPMNDVYSFRFDIADTIDGGLESLLRNDPNESDPAAGTIAEDIAVEIEYRDKNGWTRNATLPVLLSVLGQYKESGDNVRTIGLAQRGDTIAFTGCLPEYESLLSTKIYLGGAARSRLKETGGIEATSNSNALLSSALDSDPISFSSISIYEGTCRMSNYMDGKDSITGEKVESYSYGFSFSSEDPGYYYTSSSKNGFVVNPGTSATIEMRTYKHGNPLNASSLEGNFLVRLKTDSVYNLAATTSDLFVRLKYQTRSGNENVSPSYNVRTEVLNYMGYWPSSAGATDNFAYTYGLSPGNVVEFPVQLSDIAAVTGIEISLSESEDDWQMSGISVEILDSIGKRRIYKQSLKSQNSTTNYRIVRTLKKSQLPPFPINLTDPQHFVPGDSYDYSTGSGTFTPSTELDYNAVRYSMTYDETKNNYGYSKVRKTYDINVKVADDDSKNNINGDSGSKNLFYFQLMFQNGSSAFVLANQQLASDAFRAGFNEVFSIKVNRDYGDVTAVRILPESVTEDSELFDKLNIEEITITERNNGGSGMQYVINSVGWIDIDYHDSGDDKSLSGRKGRSVGELSSTYTISAKRKVANLLCEISSRPWNTTFFPLSVSISCDLDYIDTNDNPRTVSFDVVDRMYDYIKKSPKLYSAELNGSNQDLYNNMGSVSDPDFMLRPNTTDRFIIPPLADAKTLKSMTFRATNRGKGTGYWVIGGLTISRIESDTGNVVITEKGEYYRSMLTKVHCSMVKTTKTPSLTIPAGQPQPLKIDLEANKIDWIDGSSWISAVTRTPETTNDQINVYVYPSASTRNISGVNVSTALQYTMPNSKIMQISQSSLMTYGSGTENAVFYYTGLTASNMNNLSEIKLICRDVNMQFDHAIVQQIRDSVVVGTYYIPFGNSSALLGLTGKLSDNVVVSNPRRQEMFLSFSGDTKEMSLFNSGTNVNDIAIAVKYRSVLDHGINEYCSPYIYLTDVGINKISPGMMAEIPIDMQFASEITGYKIVSYGNIDAKIDGAMVINYSYSKKDTDEAGSSETIVGQTQEDIYTFPQSYTVTNSIESYKCMRKGLEGENTLNMLDLVFTTAAADSGTESGTDSPVEVTFYYQDSMKADKAWIFPDITKYIQYVQIDAKDDKGQSYKKTLTEKQFITGGEARVKLFLPDCSKVTAIKIRPYNEDGNASWKLARVEGTLMSSDENKKRIDRLVDTVFDQKTGGDIISVKTVAMTTYVTANGSSDYVKNNVFGLTLDGGNAAVIQVNTDVGSFTAKAELITNGIATDATDKVLFNKDSEKVVFYVKKNENKETLIYQITIASDENPSVKDVINIAIPVPEPEKTETTTSTSTTTGSSDTQTTTAETTTTTVASTTTEISTTTVTEAVTSTTTASETTTVTASDETATVTETTTTAVQEDNTIPE